MRIFRTTRAYFLIFFLYLSNALFVFSHSTTGQNLLEPAYVLIPRIPGALLCAFLLLRLIRSTSNLIEKTVLILSAGIFVLFMANTLYELGYRWAVFPFRDSIAIIVSCAAAALTGIRLFQIVAHHDKSDLGHRSTPI